MALSGERVYDENGKPISSTVHSDGKRSLDTTEIPSENTYSMQVKVFESLEKILSELKRINIHLSAITDEEIMKGDEQ